MCSYRDDTCKCRYVQVLLLYFLTLWRSLSPSLSNTSLSNTSLSNTRALISSFREICVRIDSLCIRCNMRVSTCGEGGGGCDDIFRILRNFLDSKISRLRLLFKCPFEILDPEIGTLCARRMTRSGEGKEGRESIQDYRGARGGGVSMKNLTKLTKLSGATTAVLSGTKRKKLPNGEGVCQDGRRSLSSRGLTFSWNERFLDSGCSCRC